MPNKTLKKEIYICKSCNKEFDNMTQVIYHGFREHPKNKQVRIIRINPFGLTKKDLEKLEEEMVRRIIDRSLPEKKEAQDRIFRESQANRYIEIKTNLKQLVEMMEGQQKATELINKKFNDLRRRLRKGGLKWTEKKHR